MSEQQIKDGEPALSAIDIMQVLPHRFPFLLVDRVEEIFRPADGAAVGRWVRAIKNVTINEQFFTGHFPHRPVMPGVLQIEAMAQCAALAAMEHGGAKKDMAIVGINEARFRKPVLPGDTLELYAEVKKLRGPILQVMCEARVRGQIVAEAELLAKIFTMES